MIPIHCKRLAVLAAASTRASAAGLRNVAQPGATKLALQEWIRRPARFPWHEVTKVAHYWLEVNAMTKPMRVREDSPAYGTHRRDAEDAEECP